MADGRTRRVQWRGVPSTCTTCRRTDGRLPGDAGGKPSYNTTVQPRREVTVRWSSQATRVMASIERAQSDQGRSHGTSRQLRSWHGRAPHLRPSNDRPVTAKDFTTRPRSPQAGKGRRFLAGGPTAIHPDGRTMLSNDWLQIVHCCGRSRRKRSGCPEESTQARWRGACPTANGAGYKASGRAPADGRIAVSLSDDAGGRERIRSSDPETGRPSGRPGLHHPDWVARDRLQPGRPELRDRE